MSLIHFRNENDLSTLKIQQWVQNLQYDQEWDIGRGRYTTLTEIDLFGKVQKIDVQKMKIRWTFNTEIIKDLLKVQFPYLKELFLNGNNIESIQVIAKIDLKNLQVLNLKQNSINNIAPLRKCNLPKLKQLDIYKNKIIDAYTLSAVNSSNLQKIWLNAKAESGNTIVSICWMAKLQSKKVSIIRMAHLNRINQNKVEEVLEKKMDHQIQFQYQSVDDRGIQWL